MTALSADRIFVWLCRVSLTAGIAFTAHAEYDLARNLGADPAIAVMLPVAIDAYVIAALRRFRALDITLSLALMGAAQVAAHLLDARVMTVNIPMVVVISLLVPVALWRTHALARSQPACVSEEAPEYVPTVELERVPETCPALPDTEDVPEVREHAKPVLAASTRRRTRVSAAVPDKAAKGSEDAVLADRVRQDFGGRVPSFRELKETYSIGQPRARRIRAVLDGGQV
ncbi:hypothetical protein [Streptomyces sp. VNUA74]|uniref:hypothetical protein n=1 Tax=Streptomyces sp. VNUA74 TaxID=3062685 RepID=UPI00280BF3B2|nr:hypothetical protein [Streptomyces sp. VNUA74]WML79201.1 hypothetical protein Q3101_04810 [Streptomyces sp. VNUA74]